MVEYDQKYYMIHICGLTKVTS